ncbi:hypothetical protein GCM10020254_04730 [Streptomyces goshikiensis]
MIWVAELTVNEAGALSNRTDVDPVRPVPVRVTVVPPVVGPWEGLMALSVGGMRCSYDGLGRGPESGTGAPPPAGEPGGGGTSDQMPGPAT